MKKDLINFRSFKIKNMVLAVKLGWQDSNLRMAESKSAALPLGDTPIMDKNKVEIKTLKSSIGQEGTRTPDTVVRSHVL
jgi:hypothetical protein